jgi:hypothetical protein
MFHYRITDGDTLILDPVIPDCASPGCFEAGLERVGCLSGPPVKTHSLTASNTSRPQAGHVRFSGPRSADRGSRRVSRRGVALGL